MSRLLRERIAASLRTASDFDAFCRDFFPEAYRRFAGGMDRVAKTTLLLDVVTDYEEIVRRLDEVMGGIDRHYPPSLPPRSAGREIVSSISNLASGSASLPVELSLEHVKAACARIVAGHRQGTGYLMRPDLMVTCAHVVHPAQPGGIIRVQFYDDSDSLEATVDSFDDKADWAVLRLSPLSRERPCLPSSTHARTEARWVAFGYPASAGINGIALAGIVRDPHGKDDQGIPVMQLYCEEAAAARGALLGGASGAPVLSNGRVIGHFRRVVPDERDRTEFGLVFACPASAYESSLTTLPTVTIYHARSPQADYDPLWYIQRRDSELLALNKLREVGVPVTLQAPEGYGKTWLVQHLLARIAQQDMANGNRTEVAHFNLRKDASPIPASLEDLLMSLLRKVLKQLGIGRVDTIIARASKGPGNAQRKFLRAFEQHVLVRPAERFLLLIEEADHLHCTPIETDFFAMLRAMSEDRTSVYHRLRLLVTIGAEAGFLEMTNHSAFFGLSAPIVLGGFSLTQLHSMASLYGLDPNDAGLRELHRLTGGHPFYSRAAMHEAVCGEKSLAQVLDATDARGGLFAASLQRLRVYVEREELKPTLCAILSTPRCNVSSEQYLKLYRKGLVVETKPGEYRLRCALFEDYFRVLYQ